MPSLQKTELRLSPMLGSIANRSKNRKSPRKSYSGGLYL